MIFGEGGNDEVYGGADGDYIDGGEGADTVYGQGGTNHCASDVKRPSTIAAARPKASSSGTRARSASDS